MVIIAFLNVRSTHYDECILNMLHTLSPRRRSDETETALQAVSRTEWPQSLLKKSTAIVVAYSAPDSKGVLAAFFRMERPSHFAQHVVALLYVLL